MKRVARLAVLLAMGLTVTAAVGQPDRLAVVASFSILADVIQNVTLGQADVTSLIPVGADPHSYEPSARDLVALSEADVIFVAGGGFEEQLLDTIAGVAPNIPVVEASTCVRVRMYGDGRDHEDGEGETSGRDPDAGGSEHHTIFGLDVRGLCDSYDTQLHEIDALKESMGFPSGRMPDAQRGHRLFEVECTHDEHSDDHEHSAVHAHGTCDPHVWSDPRSVVYWSLFIGDVVGALDPAHADQYTANAHEYAYAIDDLLRLQLEPELAVIPPENRLLLTNHETLGYFASAYGFDVLGFVLPGGSTLAEPSARDVAALVELVRSSGVKAIFVETTVVSRVAELVAAEAGTPLVSLYTDSLSDVQGPAPTYLDYTAYNFAAITDALAP
ncbi:MAG: zinc ABC transporter substrate-binding protein [Chloroflexi bacterium]|jgi:ABC-type Zn uptake system ZnuABC Zn-binding protein ZnuA|nr:zinc ABC transporter substrate-binding protein [Chloroflexota bacterium]MBV6435383.1 hypothetical protein [Anaerolineae bacterium]MCC6567304.1 zinc ABC transporter substrate-binding protein [Chloroflexota bacterium]OQY79749.1 MAG: hypothetical protein B6D42_14375 [Anaerolineae bacterium UTCFX5]